MRRPWRRSTRAPVAGLVVINETSDNTGAGAPGDSTHLLRALLDADLECSVFVGLVDPETMDDAHRAGVGSTIRVRLGGSAGGIGGDPVDVEVYVKCLTDGDIALTTPILRGSSWPLDRTARLQAGRVDVIVTSDRVQTFDRTPLLLHGIDVADCRVGALVAALPC